MCLFGGCEAAEIIAAPVLCNLRRPVASSPVEAGAFQAGGVAARPPPIGNVIRMARHAQVAQSVVERVAVAMVNDRAAPLARHVEPRQLVRRIATHIDANGPALPLGAIAGDVSGLVAPLLAPPPAKFSGLRVVIQELVQPF